MTILLITEGGLIEEKIMRSYLPACMAFKVSTLSATVPFTRLGKYNTVLIPFAPSLNTPFFKLIEALLISGKEVICMNLDQGKFELDILPKIKSINFLTGLGMRVFIASEHLLSFFLSYRLHPDRFIKPSFFRYSPESVLSQNSKNLVLALDLRWATAPKKYKKYKMRTGCPSEAIDEVVRFTHTYMENLAKVAPKIFEKFKVDYRYIFIDGFGATDALRATLSQYNFNDMEFISESKLCELLNEDSVIISNWHSLLRMNFPCAIKMFQLRFMHSSDFVPTSYPVDIDSRNPHSLISCEGIFELISVYPPELVFPPRRTIAPRCIGKIEPHKIVRYELSGLSSLLRASLRLWGFVNYLNIIRLQIRFLPYILKTTMIKKFCGFFHKCKNLKKL